MTNFVLLYVGGTYPETEEQQAEVMGAWGAWYEKVGDAVVDGGNPFSSAKSITADGVVDGASTAPAVTGYTIIQADSLDAAAALTADHPHVHYGGQVSVHETFKM